MKEQIITVSDVEILLSKLIEEKDTLYLEYMFSHSSDIASDIMKLEKLIHKLERFEDYLFTHHLI